MTTWVKPNGETLQYCKSVTHRRPDRQKLKQEVLLPRLAVNKPAGGMVWIERKLLKSRSPRSAEHQHLLWSPAPSGQNELVAVATNSIQTLSILS
jgi:hypothetical protein